MYEHPTQSMGFDAFIAIVLLATAIGVIGALMLIALEDGKGRALLRRLRCRAGKHRFVKLHCAHCKKRRHTNLRVIDGGAKGKTGSDFRF